jgi:predicted nucleic acid-binding protein
LTVARIVVLDTGPLGLASQPRGKPDRDRCRNWLHDLDRAGVRVVAPEIADYEVRRELLRVRATAGLRRLDLLIGALDFDPITSPAMRKAAEFWALTRQAGLVTAHPQALDGDCILAGQASQLGGPGDVVTIATTNVRHFTSFPGIDAKVWDTIV